MERLLTWNLGTVRRPCQAGQDPSIAVAPGDAPAVRPFEQRNQILASQPKAVAQLRGRRLPHLPERCLERPPKLLQSRLRRVAVVVDLFYTAFPRQVREQSRYGQVCVFPLQLSNSGHRPARLGQAPDQPPARVTRSGIEGGFPAGPAHDRARQIEGLLLDAM